MSALGISEKDLVALSFDLVMADKFSPLLSVGQWDIHIPYGKGAPVGNPPVHPALPEASSPMDETSTPSSRKFLKDIYIIASLK